MTPMYPSSFLIAMHAALRDVLAWHLCQSMSHDPLAARMRMVDVSAMTSTHRHGINQVTTLFTLLLQLMRHPNLSRASCCMLVQSQSSVRTAHHHLSKTVLNHIAAHLLSEHVLLYTGPVTHTSMRYCYTHHP